MKKNYKSLYPIVLLFILQSMPLLVNAQVFTFQKVYPSTINQSGKDVVQTSDGGYLIAATTETGLVNDLDIELLKTDNIGDTLWTKTYGGNRAEYPNCILPVSGGNFFVLGYSQSFGGGDQDIYLLKINSTGDTLWSKIYGGYGNEDGKKIVATADGNYVIVGASNSVTLTDNNVELMKIDPSGNVLWTKYYGGPNYESARSVQLCLDGGFILAGKTALSPSDVATLFLVKTNPMGDTIWTKTYPCADSYEGKSIVANSDGTFTLTVDDSSAISDSDVRIMKISSTGTIIWNKVYGGMDKDISKMIQPTSDGGYIVAAISRSFGWSNPDMWLLKINTLGDTLWTRHYGGAGHEHCYAARQTADDGFIVVGQTRSYSTNIEIMLLKLDSLGHIIPLVVDGDLASCNKNLNIYPNPTEGTTHINMKGILPSGAILSISNLLGQVVFSETVGPSSGIIDKMINLEDEKSGVYFVTVKSTDGIITKKLILN